jgi:hypothetical protein
MKTLGQMLMDAYTKANTIETVSLIGDRLHIEHRANANEQLEAAFLEQLHENPSLIQTIVNALHNT